MWPRLVVELSVSSWISPVMAAGDDPVVERGGGAVLQFQPVLGDIFHRDPCEVCSLVERGHFFAAAGG